ncbi:hypothetical protein MPTK1_3g14250 [Marchantia polymorpha subsp. ruderalis]|uniref:Uncharacterized protein n=2 Tax=Marchantia polymorpha TaxID=3197 RepID=A0AAF6B0N5_MARPO|nr:hypothetical protein MARPO_0004s0246 [Marchantia polymorpha]BBN05569.1 hypothetical protein Mp_3g14250 [Marchantia polymorpha subsp. ruderalis]|eukprot:PTQ49013.1 hypothetical protein MARPO_0004s0246 [Marchantia polymorpha]
MVKMPLELALGRTVNSTCVVSCMTPNESIHVREVLKLGTLAQKIMLILMIRWRNEEIK